jgi:4-hydroxy-tetrahydrodipicolinate reductase
MQTRIIVNGAQGKMGMLALETLNKHPDFEVVAALSRHDNLETAIETTKPSIVLDLTTAESVYQNTKIIIHQNVHPVIGTSGLMDDQILSLKALCENQNLGGIIVPNFSIGAVLMMHFAAKASTFMSDVEIIEAHHENKLDAPSGTALKTAEMITVARQNPKQERPLKELIPGARGANYENIHIHSLRLPGVIARQEVLFGGLGETLSITHNSIDRVSFMPGVVLACQKVTNLKALCYGLEHLLAL